MSAPYLWLFWFLSDVQVCFKMKTEEKKIHQEIERDNDAGEVQWNLIAKLLLERKVSSRISVKTLFGKVSKRTISLARYHFTILKSPLLPPTCVWGCTKEWCRSNENGKPSFVALNKEPDVFIYYVPGSKMNTNCCSDPPSDAEIHSWIQMRCNFFFGNLLVSFY